MALDADNREDNEREAFTSEDTVVRQGATQDAMQDKDVVVCRLTGDERITLELAEETLTVEKQWVQAGEVRLRKEVESRTETLPVELLHEEIQVERAPVNLMLDEGEAPQQRQEGDTLIIPVIEERLVVTKRYYVREEVRVTKRKVSERHEISEEVRSEQLHIEPQGNLEAIKEEGQEQEQP